MNRDFNYLVVVLNVMLTFNLADGKCVCTCFMECENIQVFEYNISFLICEGMLFCLIRRSSLKHEFKSVFIFGNITVLYGLVYREFDSCRMLYYNFFRLNCYSIGSLVIISIMLVLNLYLKSCCIVYSIMSFIGKYRLIFSDLYVLQVLNALSSALDESLKLGLNLSLECNLYPMSANRSYVLLVLCILVSGFVFTGKLNQFVVNGYNESFFSGFFIFRDCNFGAFYSLSFCSYCCISVAFDCFTGNIVYGLMVVLSAHIENCNVSFCGYEFKIIYQFICDDNLIGIHGYISHDVICEYFINLDILMYCLVYVFLDCRLSVVVHCLSKLNSCIVNTYFEFLA